VLLADDAVIRIARRDHLPVSRLDRPVDGGDRAAVALGICLDRPADGRAQLGAAGIRQLPGEGGEFF
jgi:hypothetical protein